MENKPINDFFCSLFQSPIGEILIFWEKEGIFEVSFIKKDSEKRISCLTNSGYKIKFKTSPIDSQLKEYFEGRRKFFLAPLILNGTPYQKRVWEETLKIPYGETCSYIELARRIGNPMGSRSVGTALKLNHLSIIIPCHRVIRNSGELGSYTGGSFRKRWLLMHEYKHK
ncbi:MAG: methylated-DNA--[protein]-cysteine S-methyltransferase [candidate division WOR-3 bacterium]